MWQRKNLFEKRERLMFDTSVSQYACAYSGCTTCAVPQTVISSMTTPLGWVAA